MHIKYIFSLLIILNCTIANSNLPNLGNETQAILSSQEEFILGKSLLHQLHKNGFIYQDLLINDYINHLGNNLLANSEQIDLKKFNFFIVNNDNEINAFAFFGGHIGVYPELIKLTETEGELAAILAHEISHITQRHSVQQLLQHKKLMPITIAGAAAGAMLNPHIASLIIGSHLQHMINFSRKHEQEADRIGIQLLIKTGFDPNSMPNILQRFSQFSNDQQKIPEYLLTHPMFESRISDIISRIKQNQYKQFADHLDYYLIKARISANSNTNKTNLLSNIEWQLKTHRYNNYPALKYEQALVLQNLQKTTQATKILLELADQYPNNLIIQLSLANLQTTVNPALAKITLTKLIKLYPDYFPLVLSYAQMLLIFNLPIEANNILMPYNHDNIFDLIEEPMLYELLIACFQKLNNQAEILFTQAKLLFITDHLLAAEAKLDQALQLANKKSKITKFKLNLKKFM